MSIEFVHDTFLGIAPEENSYADSRVVVVRVPYDATTSYGGGARNGPAAVIEASQQVELWDLELGREPAALGIHTMPALLPCASGPEEMLQQVEQVCAGVLADGKLPLVIGGEHSVTVGAARACRARCSELSFLQIDAHLDLRESYEGSRFSHACVARRLLELGSLVAVGPRTACPEELEVIAAAGLRPIWGHEIAAARSREAWIADAVSRLGPRVYVTLDVDGLDPSVIAATGTPVPGGLSWYDALALLRAVGEQREVVGCDLVELAPAPGLHGSSFAAALLAYKMIGYFVRDD